MWLLFYSLVTHLVPCTMITNLSVLKLNRSISADWIYLVIDWSMTYCPGPCACTLGARSFLGNGNGVCAIIKTQCFLYIRRVLNETKHELYFNLNIYSSSMVINIILIDINSIHKWNSDMKYENASMLTI